MGQASTHQKRLAVDGLTGSTDLPPDLLSYLYRALCGEQLSSEAATSR
jgi:hypothetical protein